MPHSVFDRPPDLEAELVRLLDQIPVGRVTTYAALARALGHVIASRWVGHYLLHHPHHSDCPCHRVVRVSGELGVYVSGKVMDKRRYLRYEGVPVEQDRVRLDAVGFDQFRSARPLEKLRVLQEEMASRISLVSPKRKIRVVGGVDVSYGKSGRAVGACAILDMDSGELIGSLTVPGSVCFPYISSYLTFRELPMLLKVLREAERAGYRPDAWVVDGSGILHPRRAGIATMLGVVTGNSTIGITKKLLCGEVSTKDMAVGEVRAVSDRTQPLGFAIRHRQASHRPLYISPGHKISLAKALDVVSRQPVRAGLPEVIFWADRLSRRAAKVTSA